MVAAPDVGGLHDLAVHVELELAHRTVAHPDRAGASISAEMVELPLDEVAPAVDAVHDLQVSAALVPADLLQKPHELVGLAIVAHGIQRGQREGRVPEPDEPVVPVAHPADRLGE